MDRIKYLLPVLVLTALSSCTRETPYTPGAEDPAGCYRVYFPEQPGYGQMALRPSSPRILTFKAVRERTDGEITVPLTVEASAPDVFEVDLLHFDDGQAEATLTVRFPKAQEQVGYSCDIRIDDPQYASNYMMERRYVSFGILIGNRKIEPKRRTDWTFQYYSGYYYVRAVDGNYGFITVPASAGDPEDPAYVRQVLENWSAGLEDHYAGISPTFYTDYSTMAWALFSGASHYGATPKSSGYSGSEKNLVGFMVGVTGDPYATGDYQYITFTLE